MPNFHILDVVAAVKRNLFPSTLFVAVERMAAHNAEVLASTGIKRPRTVEHIFDKVEDRHNGTETFAHCLRCDEWVALKKYVMAGAKDGPCSMDYPDAVLIQAEAYGRHA